jgi:hypothetical protein
MKYILFAYGEYKNNQKLVKQIVNQMVPIASDINLKYSYGDQSMIVVIESDLEFDLVNKYVTFTMKEYAAMFFLMSCTDKMSYNIPTEMQTLFFGEDDEMLKKMISEVSEDDIDDMFNNLSENDLDDIYEEEDTLEQILKQSKTKKKKEYIPTLDEILDKISEQGMGALTQKEKEVLENYSK